MHLKQLKLAGFKSFVDPIVIPFASQLVAVVGPNGCGKSNIIDAVRWVMGESHAKNLRGESITDVIFKGSSQRKPVGQASVELIFDNSMGRLVGQYASYQEIAVKRVVTLDGDSSYYLNGSRCRRRDITDIFLGTGANARGYSIIGQDTISRLIEAHPDDLRAYLEEAAGVSKYKERRRETLQRIQHTHENLDRVADIRDELEKQLARLERQAKAAESYIVLKEAERVCRSEILALKWRALDTELVQIQTQVQELAQRCTDNQVQSVMALQEIDVLRVKEQAANTNHQQMQVQFYQLATEIARLEEALLQHQRDKQRLANDKQHITEELSVSNEQLQHEQATLHRCEQEAAVALLGIEQSRQELSIQQQAVDVFKQQEINWNNSWRQVETQHHHSERDAEVEQVRILHLAERYQQLQLNFEKLKDEQVALDINALEAAVVEFQIQCDHAHQIQLLAVENYDQSVQLGISMRQQQADVLQQLNVVQDKIQALAIEQAALLAAQQTALYHADDGAASTRLRFETKPRLAEVMTVADDWVPVCEYVLHDCLQAIVLDTMDSIWPILSELDDQSMTFVQSKSLALNMHDYPRLADKVTGIMPHWSLALEHIFAASDLDEALTWLPKLGSDQSVITPDGQWLGHGWVRILPLARTDEKGVLARQQRLTELQVELAQQRQDLDRLTAQRDDLHQVFVDHQAEQTLKQQQVTDSQEQWRAGQAELLQKENRLTHSLSRQTMLVEEYENVQQDLEACATSQAQAEQRYQLATKDKDRYEQQKQQLLSEKVSWEAELSKARNNLDMTRQSLHHAELESQRATTKVQQLATQIKHVERQIETLQTRMQTVLAQEAALVAPAADDHALLAQKTQQHAQLETQVAVERQGLELLQQQLISIERAIKQDEQQTKRLQEQLQQLQLQEQALVLREAGLSDALMELGADLSNLLANLPIEMTQAGREQDLLKIDEKIKRLGAINLLAIEEYQTDLQRKQHLDEQYLDLKEALATLEVAIAKMDKETQQRLKDTFENVNRSFQQLFPRLFGGGHAQLTLTCDNLLEAGILVMAQPPGKRNSTIHMLSGGEKAMTAVALVFAIFQQNPSPFCMLDEVDAPLDESNVRRFCDLVKEMSECVQFLFITHNKVTMELASNLIGVTMREPGVSRIVSVDMETYF